MGARKAPKLKIANFDQKMAFEGQNWPRCTKWGLTNSFRTVKGIFEPMTYKIVLFTNNYPTAGGHLGSDRVLIAEEEIVDCPTKLFCIWIFRTNTKDIAGQTAISLKQEEGPLLCSAM